MYDQLTKLICIALPSNIFNIAKTIFKQFQILGFSEMGSFVFFWPKQIWKLKNILTPKRCYACPLSFLGVVILSCPDFSSLFFCDNQHIVCAVYKVWPQTIWLNSSHQTIQTRSIPEDTTRLDEKEWRQTSRIFAQQPTTPWAKKRKKILFRNKTIELRAIWKIFDSNISSINPVHEFYFIRQ